jgi:hypothetical protein
MTDAILHASKSKPPEFFHNAVRYLCIDSNTPVDEATQVLKLCAGIVDFSTTRGLSKPEFLPILAEMRVQRFGGCLTNFFEGYDRVNLTHPLFASLTHLDIFDVMSEGLAGICAQIPTLPKLTHLALDRNARLDTVEALLPECPRLKLLLLLWSRSDKHEYELAQVPHVYDVRLVMGMYDESWADWEAGAKGLPHLWSMGDEFVARKRTGAIEGTVPFFPLFLRKLLTYYSHMLLVGPTKRLKPHWTFRKTGVYNSSILHAINKVYDSQNGLKLHCPLRRQG